MTLQKWLDSVNGKFIDVDGNHKFWCVDLMRSYLRDCLNLDPWYIKPALNAKDIFYNFPANNKKFKKIYNTPNNMPKPGDIIFWKIYPLLYGYSGHVAIVTYADLYNIISMDQNYPTNSCSKLTKHSYKGCLGWLSIIK